MEWVVGIRKYGVVGGLGFGLGEEKAANKMNFDEGLKSPPRR